MKHQIFAYAQLYNENLRLYNQCNELNERIQNMEYICKQLAENENANVNKILLLENKIISMKRKIKKPPAKFQDNYNMHNEQLFYLSNKDASENLSIASEISSLTNSDK